MLLRIEMEAAYSWVEGGTIARWHIAEGAAVRFGDPLCDIKVDEVHTFKRDQKHSRLLSGRFPKTFKQSAPADARIRLTSADDGTVVAIHKAEGCAVRVGDLLAVATTGADDAGASLVPTENTPRFRVAAAVLDVDGEQWDS
jgi:pyruvate/2-oxoglutarate dehydrogenase complex dihydrolipoamide acyltransferase (E2) component